MQTELYQKMKAFFRDNVGGVVALYSPKNGETAENYKGEKVPLLRATKDLKEFRRCVYIYMLNTEIVGQKGPRVKYKADKTQLMILPE
ncbi:hypothetical protein [uncultured Mediterranean phage uvMED]|nr:hypothetical protein [uncultured Mediterranean phage uvMED]BAR22553.1 hypothetical protein [uncultured Mediterranean phage uvMED]